MNKTIGIKLIGKYIKENDVKSPYLEVEKLIILDEEIKRDLYLIDTGCDYDIAINEIFISQKTKEKLENSGKGRWESNPDGKPDRLLTLGTITLNEDYSKEVFICITFHDGSVKGEKIIGITLINDFISNLDPFKNNISLTSYQPQRNKEEVL